MTFVTLKSYVTGDWNSAFKYFERFLELWDSDGPTKALQRYMSFFRFQMPETWTGFRNIDEEIDMDEINRRMGAEEGNGDADEDSPK